MSLGVLVSAVMALPRTSTAAPPPPAACGDAASCVRRCDAGDSAACVAAGVASEQGKSKDALRALDLFQRACEAANAEGCRRLGDLHANGAGLPVDLPRARAEWQQACKLGDGPSCLQTAGLCEARAKAQKDLRGAAEELNKGAGFLQLGCNKGELRACVLLARQFLWGSGVRADPVSAAALLQRACDRNTSTGCELLSRLYEEGRGVSADPRKAAELRQRAKQLGTEPLVGVPQLPVEGAPLVKVQSSVAAEILVDGFLAGTSPVSVAVPPGKHRIEARIAKFDPIFKDIVSVAFKQEQVTFQPPGLISVVTRPSKANLTIDGVQVGKSPWSGPVTPGEHTVWAELENWVAAAEVVRIDSGARAEVALTLAEPATVVQVNTEPSGAEVRVDGQSIGVSPQVKDVKPGPHLIEVRLPGYKPEKRSIKVLLGTTSTTLIPLVAEQIELLIESSPSDAMVRIDGQQMGFTPFRGLIAPGEHNVELTRAGHAPRVEKLSVTPGSKKVTRELTLLVTEVPVQSTPVKTAADLQRACSAEDGPACAELASNLRAGRGVPIDLGRARQLDGRACALKVGASCLELGRAEEKEAALARSGPETTSGMTRSAAYLSAGCEAKAGAACSELARLYAAGCGVKADPAAAAKLARQGCELGDKPGCRYLAYLFEEGVGLRRDLVRATELSQRNADARALSAPPVCDDAPGLLSFESAVEGVELSIDGFVAGPMPVVVRLALGEHVVVARAAKRDPLRLVVSVARGQRGRQVIEWPAAVIEPSRVMIETTPPGASVAVDGTVVGLTPWEGEVAKGEHEVELSLAGFSGETRTINATPRQPCQLKVRLKPAPRPEDQPAAFTVTSTPAGATLALDGKVLGKTPWSGKVTRSEHEVSLTLAGYEPFNDLTSAPGQVVATLTPVPSGVRLSLPTTPAELEVRIDEQVVVAASGVFVTTPGRHLVELRAPGFVSAKSTVKVAPGQVSVVSMAMTLAPVVAKQGLRVTSEPAGATVSVNDVKVGLTPYDGFPLEVGSYRVGLTLSGYLPASSTLEVKKKQLSEQHLMLSPAPVSVAIESTPSGARLFLDGEERGVTPQMLKVTPGSHRVYLVLEGHATVDEVRELQVAAAPKWDWILKPNVAPLPVAVPPVDAGVPMAAPVSELEVLRSLLADEAVATEVKTQKFVAYAKSHEELTELVAVAAPAPFKDELCVTWSARVRPVRYQASAVDSFGNELTPDLYVNGKKYAPLPFDGALPWCARVIEARAGSVIVNRNADKAFDAKVLNTDVFAFPGRSRRASFSALGEAAFAPLLSADSLSRTTADLQQQNFGFGVRFDFWGQAFHFSLAVKGSQLFRESLFRDTSLLFAPLGDLYLGFSLTAGSERVRYRATLDLGAWSLLCPSVRLGHTVSVGERLFLTLTMDAAYVPNFLVRRLAAGTSADLMWMFGGTFAIGVGF